MYTCLLKMGIVNPTTHVYQFVIDKSKENPVAILQLFVMVVLGLCVNFKSRISYMFYVWDF